MPPGEMKFARKLLGLRGCCAKIDLWVIRPQVDALSRVRGDGGINSALAVDLNVRV